MALSDWIARTFYGADDLQAESDRLDERLRQENEADRALYGEEWFATAEANRAASRVDAVADIGGEFTAEALAENLDESGQLVAGKIKGGLNSVGGFVWSALPWWVWLGAAVALFVYLGGGVWIRGFLTARRGAA